MALEDTNKTGDLAAAGKQLTIPSGLNATVGIQVSGNGAGFTLVPQASMDGGSTWINVEIFQAGVGASETPATAITTNGNWEFAFGGFDYFRLINTVGGTGNAIVHLNANQAVKASLSKAAGGGGGVVVDALTNAQLRSTPLDVNFGKISGERDDIDALAVTTNNNGYKVIPPSSTDVILCTETSTGALGDTIARIIVIVTNDAACAVSLKDGAGTVGLNGLTIFQNNTLAGTYSIDLGDIPSIEGGWKITTGAGVTVIVIGRFS